ncbi:MAG: TerC family protein [Peptococcaceae bacterium]|nr:TerC family protein [Peptococcaceae bacterium]
MEAYGNISFFSVLQIIFIDLVLSGDNAVIIAMATRNLHPRSRKKAFVLGASGAILLRIFFAGVTAITLIKVPLMQLIGGVILLWIAVKLLTENSETRVVEPQKRLISAVKTIILADLIMSLDNVLAVGGASHGSLILLVAGLLFSMTLLMVGSQLLASMMSESKLVTDLGAGIIAWVAGDMIGSEKCLKLFLSAHTSLFISVLAVMTVFFTAEMIQSRCR